METGNSYVEGFTLTMQHIINKEISFIMVNQKIVKIVDIDPIADKTNVHQVQMYLNTSLQKYGLTCKEDMRPLN